MVDKGAAKAAIRTLLDELQDSGESQPLLMAQILAMVVQEMDEDGRTLFADCLPDGVLVAIEAGTINGVVIAGMDALFYASGCPLTEEFDALLAAAGVRCYYGDGGVWLRFSADLYVYVLERSPGGGEPRYYDPGDTIRHTGREMQERFAEVRVQQDAFLAADQSE
ncbi:MAG: hypothetical protein ACYDAG_15615 [Chloroflexota bacterium]